MDKIMDFGTMRSLMKYMTSEGYVLASASCAFNLEQTLTYRKPRPHYDLLVRVTYNIDELDENDNADTIFVTSYNCEITQSTIDQKSE